MKTFTLQKNKGFTIIETLVAITILMISIAGPLTIAQKSLMAASYAKDQVIASFLAQDLMEKIKNDRDVNIATFGAAWIANINSRYDCNGNACILNIMTTDGTYGTGSGVASKFSRRAFATPINDHEILIRVVVSWSNDINQVILENHMFNITL